MCIIIRQAVLALRLEQQKMSKKAISKKAITKIKDSQAGFTLSEVLVSLCIVCFIMGALWQWGIVMQRTATVMAQNQQALLFADQAYADLAVQNQDGWQTEITSEPTGGLLYETTVTISAPNRKWEFYYISPVKIVGGNHAL